MLSIPLPASGEYRIEETVSLDGTAYTLRINWNERAQAWYLDISDVDGTILTGKRMVCGWPLLIRTPGRRGPLGELMLYPTKEVATEPGVDLSDYLLLYWSADEVAAL